MILTIFCTHERERLLAHLKAPGQDRSGKVFFASDVYSYDQGLVCYLRNFPILSIIHVGTPSSLMLFANLPVSDLHFTVGYSWFQHPASCQDQFGLYRKLSTSPVSTL